MSFWSFENLRAVVAGRWLNRPAAVHASEPAGLSTDSRTLRHGQIFCALRGPRHDGHDHLQAAADAGAALLLVERGDAHHELHRPAPPVLKVEDTYAALARLAAAYRRTLRGEVIAITGSVGKTTTKQMVHAVLAPLGPGTVSPRSYNNRVGVPLTILNAEPADRYIVVEVGTNAPGEIASLARIVEPDIAVITAIGLAHVEKLGSIEGIAAEKAALLRFLPDHGLAVVNGDAATLTPYLKPAERVIRFGRGEACDLRLTDRAARDEMQSFQVNNRAWFDLPLPGEHNALNALAAVAVGRHLNLRDEQIAAGLRSLTTPAMRLQVVKVGGRDGAVTVINDAYNANPTSMAAALTVLRDFPTDGRRVAVLGDMAELGERGPELHRQLGRQTLEAGVDLAVLIGRLGLYAAETISKAGREQAMHTEPALDEAAAERIAEQLRPGDVVLLKASRVMGLERLLPAIERRFTAPAIETDDPAARRAGCRSSR